MSLSCIIVQRPRLSQLGGVSLVNWIAHASHPQTAVAINEDILSIQILTVYIYHGVEGGLLRIYLVAFTFNLTSLRASQWKLYSDSIQQLSVYKL